MKKIAILIMLLAFSGRCFAGTMTITSAAGSGDITDVFSESSGDANTMVIGTGEYLDGGTATSDATGEGILLPRANDVSAATGDGEISWDADNDKLYVGTGAAVKEIISTEVDPTVDTDDEIIAIINASPSTQIVHEAGGLEADVNGYDGLIGITGGATYNQTGTTTQIIIFDGAGAPTSAALSSEATMDNAGAVTLADSVSVASWNLTTPTITTSLTTSTPTTLTAAELDRLDGLTSAIIDDDKIDTFSELDTIVVDKALVETTTAFTGDVTGNVGATVIADSVTVTGWTMGASVATTPAANDADTSLATTAFCETSQDYLKTAELTAATVEAALTNDPIDFGTGAVTAAEFNLSDDEYIEWGADENLTFESTRTDFLLSDDLLIEDLHPSMWLIAKDTGYLAEGGAWGWHYHPGTEYPIGFWRGTEDGTGVLVSPDKPAIWCEDDTTPMVHLPYGATIVGNIKDTPRHIYKTIFDPLAVQTEDNEVCLIPLTDAAIHVTSVIVTLDAAGNEVAGDVKYADTFIGLASATVINIFDTASGVYSSGAINVAVAASKCVYLSFDSAPNTAIKQMCIDITYSYD